MSQYVSFVSLNYWVDVSFSDYEFGQCLLFQIVASLDFCETHLFHALFTGTTCSLVTVELRLTDLSFSYINEKMPALLLEIIDIFLCHNTTCYFHNKLWEM